MLHLERFLLQKLVSNEETKLLTLSGISIQGLYDVQFFVLPSSGPVEVFTLGASIDSSITVSINLVQTNPKASLKNFTVIGQVESLAVTISLENSNVGSFSTSLIQLLLNDGVKELIIPFINKYLLSNPVPIPPIPNVHLTNVTLTYATGYMMLGIDAVYV